MIQAYDADYDAAALQPISLQQRPGLGRLCWTQQTAWIWFSGLRLRVLEGHVWRNPYGNPERGKLKVSLKEPGKISVKGLRESHNLPNPKL